MMRIYKIFFLISTIFISVFAEGQKRGLAYGHNSPEDLEVLSPRISWWYNWSESPESSVANVYEDYGFKFIPMTWNGNFSETKLRQFLDKHPETKYLLAYNEPNFLEQANMKPSTAAAIWPRIEKIADEYNLEIVSPAVNFCGNCVSENGVTYTDPVQYLDDFFAACPDCRVDHIAIHCYMNTVSALEWFVGLFKKYGKPIWLTEFAGWEPNGTIKSMDDQINYMMEAVEYLEKDTSIFRYAWFIGRWNGINSYPFIDVLGNKGELTELGEVYKNMPTHNENSIVEIPSKIEAENYIKMSGIQLERTSDSTGFFNIKAMDSGDWLEYKINVPETKTYPLNMRIAANRRINISLLVNGEMQKNIRNSNYEGIDNWYTFSDEILLEKGEYSIKLEAVSSGFKINWFQIGDLATNSIILTKEKSDFMVYPNPSFGKFNIRTDKEIKKLLVYDLTGEKVYETINTEKIDLGELPNGIYFITGLIDGGKVLGRKKLLIQR